jgi:CxxC motif-containing protein (DUF1111 family)
MRLLKSIFIVFILVALGACKKAGSIQPYEEQDWFSGGNQTVFSTGSDAFSLGFPGLTGDKALNHEIGDAAFEATFVSSPAPKHPGLGPIFNNVSCISCHVSDGRGKAPETGEELSSLLIRISIPGQDSYGGTVDVPNFGGQFQQKAVFGKQKEGDVDVNYSYQTFTFSDGESYELRTPTFTLLNTYLPLPAGVMTSPRLAPPVFGLGLLEAIPDASIIAREDINDADNDGISGKVNYVWNILAKKKTIGKFGWKAGNPSIIQQTASAYLQDMGITTFLFPQESSFGQSQYDNLQDDAELSDSLLYAVTFYMKTLAVPARRNVSDPDVIRGKALFNEAKCAACHTPFQRTAVNVAFKELSNQLIFPYTDLLLHDMGDELSDNRPDHLATGKEWRTPPLWGIGLTEIVNGHGNFLHDGRARTLTEAIMWHGGEGNYSRNYFKNLPIYDRKALLKFLKSL